MLLLQAVAKTCYSEANKQHDQVGIPSVGSTGTYYTYFRVLSLAVTSCFSCVCSNRYSHVEKSTSSETVDVQIGNSSYMTYVQLSGQNIESMH
jgi:hypothetical protein